MPSYLRLAAFPLLLLCLLLPGSVLATASTQQKDHAATSLRMRPQELASPAEATTPVTLSERTVEEAKAPSPAQMKETVSVGPRPKTPHPRRYMDQQTTAVVTLGLGGLLLLFGIATNLIRGTTSAFMAMIAGIGTICLVLGALFVIVGIAMLIAAG